MLEFNQLPESLQSSIQRYVANKNAETPLILFEPKVLEYNFNFFIKELDFKPEDVFFSLKSNNTKPVVDLLTKMGAGFEIGSSGEFNIMSSYGITPNRIIYSNPVKIPSHIEEAGEYGINCFAVDCKSEIDKVAHNAPNSGIYIRMNISNEGAEWELTRKFGADVTEVVELFHHAMGRNLKPLGVTIHVGWNNKHLETWENTMKVVEIIVNDCFASGIPLQMIDLGGGFPAHLINQYDAIQMIAKTIMPYLSIFREKFNLRIIAEPGSFMVANSAAMLTQVFDIIERNGKKWVYINSGINQGFHWIHSGLEYGITQPESKSEKTEMANCVVTGPTCDTHDIFAENIELPATIAIDDHLVIYPAGAYISTADCYNGFSCPPLIEFSETK